MKKSAREFAKKAHLGQKRKSTGEAYITHPIRVAMRLEDAGFSDEIVCAGYLHDVAEDTNYTLEDIEKEFGQNVAALVASHTEDKSKSWDERKQHTVAVIKHAPAAVKYIIIADKLDNLLDLEQSLKTQGDKVWTYFNAGKAKQKWYNESIVKNMYTGLHHTKVPDYFAAYEKAVKRVFG